MLATRLVDALYTDAMVLADEVRAYFDDANGSARDALTPLERVLFSCESLKITTRLMQVIAWLLTERAVAAGELALPSGERAAARRLGPAVPSEPAALATLPAPARRFVEASNELHARAARLEAGMTGEAVASPARHLLHRLHQSF